MPRYFSIPFGAWQHFQTLFFDRNQHHRTSQIDKFKTADTNILRELGRFGFFKITFWLKTVARLLH